MLDVLFPITDSWSYATFFLYLFVTFIVTNLCKHGAIIQFKRKKSSVNIKNSIYLKKENMYYFTAYLILLLIASLRTSNVGSDTAVYVGYFNSSSSFNFSIQQLFSFNQIEPGFQIYLEIVKNITNNYNIFFLITYSMVAYSYIRFIRYFFDEKSDYLFLQIFIFFYVSNMSGMRSAMGMIFLLPSFIALSKQKYIKSIALTLCACCFHYTMMFNLGIIVMVWVLGSPYFKRKRWIFPTFMLIVSIFSYAGLNILNGLISTTKYGFYTTSIEDLSLLGSLFYVIFTIFIFCYHENLMRYIKNKEILGSMYYISISFLIVYPAIFLTSAYRIPNYYAMPRLTIWASIVKIIESKIKPDSRMYFRIIIQILVVLYLLFKFTRSAVDGKFSYQFLWD